MEKVEDNRNINSSLTCKPHNVDMKRYKMIPYQGQNTWVLIIVVPWSKIFLNHIHIYLHKQLKNTEVGNVKEAEYGTATFFPGPEANWEWSIIQES